MLFTLLWHWVPGTVEGSPKGWVHNPFMHLVTLGKIKILKNGSFRKAFFHVVIT